jgi:hypothetical protein
VRLGAKHGILRLTFERSAAMPVLSSLARPDARFAASAAAPGLSSARPDDELLPFLNNFHDIFTTIGVVILFVGLGHRGRAGLRHGWMDPETLTGSL